MRLVLGLAAASTVVLAAASANAQDPGRYPPTTYDRGYTPSSPQPSSSYPPAGYDRSGSAYDRSAQSYDRGAPQGSYGQGQGGYDQGGGAEPDLARELNLSAAQRPAYRDYQAAFAPDEARERQDEDEQRRLASLTTPQRLDAARTSMDRDRADFERTAAATRRFYAQLSPAQQRTFDRLTAPPPPGEGDEGGGPSSGDPSGRPPR